MTQIVHSNSQENKLLLQIELQKLAFINSAELLNKKFRLFMYMNKVFCIDVKWLRKDKMSWSVYWINHENKIIDERQMSTSAGSAGAATLIKEVMSMLTDDQIQGAQKVWFGAHRFKSSDFENSGHDKNMPELIIAKTEEQIKSAHLERKIFKNPLMWKYKLEQN